MPSLRNAHKLLDPDIRAKNLRAARYGIRGGYWDLLRPDVPDPIFIVGCSRSGTTVTYETIAAAPEVLSFGWEIPEFWQRMWGPHRNDWESDAAGAEHARPEFADMARRHFYARLGRGQVLDKTCINVMRVPFLHRLFPHARFIYIHRDGRDNVSSLMEGWRHHGHFGLGKLLGPSPSDVRIENGEFREWSFFLPPGWRAYNRASLANVCAFQWSTANRMALDAGRAIPPSQWLRVRYEDIFDRPLQMFEEVFAWLQLPFGDAVRNRCMSLATKPTSIIGSPPAKQKWREHNPEAIRRILPLISPQMVELGYDPAG